jgi:hypothetical protein
MILILENVAREQCGVQEDSAPVRAAQPGVRLDFLLKLNYFSPLACLAIQKPIRTIYRGVDSFHDFHNLSILLGSVLNPYGLS